MSNTIDEILMSLVEKVAPDEDGLSQHKGLESQDLAEDKAIQTSKQAILKLIAEREREAKLDTLEELLDYYTPYRPMLDSAESMAVRLKIASCIAKLEGDSK